MAKEQHFRRNANLEALAFRSFGRSLERVINYKAVHGVSPSDDTIWRVLLRIQSMVDGVKKNDALRMAFWFLARIEIESQHLLDQILKSDLMPHLVSALGNAPLQIQIQAIHAVHNLVRASDIEHMPAIHRHDIFRPLFALIRSKHLNVGNGAASTLSMLFKKSVKTIDHHKERRAK